MKSKRSFLPYGIALFSLLLLVDQYTKHFFLTNFAPHQSVKAIPGLWFTYVQNTGAIWGILRDGNMIFIWLSVVAFGLLLFFFDKFETVTEKIALTLIMAGLWGNLLDRVLHGFVIDFINLRWWPVFNIADACISVGIVILLLEQWKKKKHTKK